jgi:hypothetical protein
LNWMRMIQMGNLVGNTFDALLYRLGIRRRGAGQKGERAIRSRLQGESTARREGHDTR